MDALAASFFNQLLQRKGSQGKMSDGIMDALNHFKSRVLANLP
jgi:hypothetical protein